MVNTLIRMTECVSPRPSSFSDGESPARATSDSPVAERRNSTASVTGGRELPCENLAAGHGSPGHGSPGHGSAGHGSPGHGSAGHGLPGHGSAGHGSADGYSSVAGTKEDAARGEDERTIAAAANDLCLDGHKVQAELLAKVP